MFFRTRWTTAVDTDTRRDSCVALGDLQIAKLYIYGIKPVHDFSSIILWNGKKGLRFAELKLPNSYPRVNDQKDWVRNYAIISGELNSIL